MQRHLVLVLSFLIAMGIAPRLGVADEPSPAPREAPRDSQKADSANVPNEPATPIRLRLKITSDEPGKEGVIARPQFITTTGRAVSLKIGHVAIEVSAVAEPDAASAAPDPTAEALAIDELTRKWEAEVQLQRLYRALQKRVSVSFDGAPLADVVKTLAARAGVNIVVDPSGLDDAGQTMETEVTFTATSTRLCSVLDQILEPLDLDYALRDEVIKITSVRKARGEFFMRTYPIADLTSIEKDGEMVPDAEATSALLETIAETIAAETWDRKGGLGSLRMFEARRSLVVRQTKDVHDEIAGYLARLRRERSTSAVRPD